MNARALAVTLSVVVFAIFLPSGVPPTSNLVADAADPGIDDMSIDMDPSGTPANNKGTGTDGVVGSIETCARINENGIMDADEDAVDTLLIDITAKGIGPSDPMVSFGATLNFPDALVKVVSRDVTGQLVGADPDSLPGDASQPVPDLLSPYIVAGFDTGLDSFESGDGPLARIGIESVTASAGVGDLTLSAAGILGPFTTGGHSPATLGAAKVAVNRACPGASIQGDVDCNGVVNSVDGLKVMRYTIRLSVAQLEPCYDIGSGGPPLQGDVDCSGSVTLVDSLKILRYVAGLSVNQTEPCPDIGTPGG